MIQPFHKNKCRASFQAGQEDFYEEIYEKFKRGIFSFTWRELNRNTADAEDMTALAFAKLWENRHEILSVAHARRWLYKVARNEIIIQNKRKGYWITATRELKYGAAIEENDTMTTERAYSEILSQVIKEIDQLPEPAKTIFGNIHIGHKTGKETARSLGLSQAAVSRHDHKARKILRNTLLKSNYFEVMF